MERSDIQRLEGLSLDETVGSNTFIVLPCAVEAQARRRADAIVQWLEDTDEGGGADLLVSLPEVDECRSVLQGDLEGLQTVDFVFTRVLCTLIEKFDFDYFTYDVEQRSGEDSFSSLRQSMKGFFGKSYYVCSGLQNGSPLRRSDHCGNELCIRSASVSGRGLAGEQLGDCLRFLFSLSLSERDLVSLRILLTVDYIYRILPGEMYSVADLYGAVPFCNGNRSRKAFKGWLHSAH